MEELLRDATNRAIKYLGTMRERRVSPAPSAIEGLAGFAKPLQDQPLAPAKVL
ncbi:MAG: hypothetical protein H6Q85_1802, partial [candidate division NC10 bacterium]|nr:hypothetical protein [candidate division NC10 bacterium]